MPNNTRKVSYTTACLVTGVFSLVRGLFYIPDSLVIIFLSYYYTISAHRRPSRHRGAVILHSEKTSSSWRNTTDPLEPSVA